MSVISLLSKLKMSGIRVRLVDDKLKLNAPKGTLTSDLLNELKQQREQVIEFLRRTGKEIDYTPIEPMEKREYYELSSAQKRLYLIHRMIPDTTAYNIPMNVPLMVDPDLDSIKEWLTCVFKQLIARHESFRTSFEMVDGQPVQRTHDEVEFEVRYYSVERKAGGFTRPFDLTKAPLLRAGVVNSGDANRILILMVDMHHIISDGMSQDILVKDFMTLYNKNRLLPLRLQYKDYAQWQNTILQTDELKQQEEFWLRVFEDNIPVLNLPTDYPRPGVRDFEGDVLSFGIDKEKTARLKQIALREDVTLFMVLLAVYSIFISKISGQEDIVMGTPIAGRRHADLEHIIGMFVNTLALRNAVEVRKRFFDFLRDVKERTIKAFENQEYPFEALVEKVAGARDTGRNPLFDVMLTLQNMEKAAAGDARVEISKDFEAGAETGLERNHPGNVYDNKYKQRISKFDLTLQCFYDGENLLFAFEYCTKLFKKKTIERFKSYFKKIISLVALDPEIKLWQVEIITGKEKQQILYEFNDTKADYPRDKTIHELFAEQAEKTPDSTAVVVGAQGAVPLPRDHVSLTYKELNQKSDQVARLLCEKGVGPDTVVGIMEDRSIELIIGILGILKAGGAYLPIDPDYPRERISYILKDSNARVLLSEVSKVSDLHTPAYGHPSQEGTSSAYRNPLSGVMGAPPGMPEGRGGSSLAYIIYTSGSTGKPKGVMVKHENVVRLVKNTDYIQFRQGDRLVQTGAVEFDASTFEIWGSLLNGLSLYFVPKEEILSTEQLKEVLQKYDIGTMWLTSPLFNRLSGVDIEIFKGLRNLLVGGDVLSPVHIGKVRSRYPQLNIINGYGPTENTTFSTTFLITREYKERIPIGKPIANSTAYIVDEAGVLVPVGVPGELWVGGDGVSRGYLNNPESTAVSYKSYRTYRTYISKRIYKTGDLARWLPDGNIEFLGRIDHQVKIRGYRIEPGEIEYHLQMHPEVKDAKVVKVNENADINKPDSGKQNLCAYFVARQSWVEGNGEKSFSIPGLKKYLAGKVPDYMIPAFIIQMEKIPLTPNGKVDLEMLPQPREVESQTGSFYVAPETGMQRIIAATWKEVLGRDKVGIRDNFFDLGGNSLDFIMVGNKLQEKLKREIPVITLFTYPTIGSLEEYLSRDGGNDVFEDSESQSDRSQLVDEGKSLMQQTLSRLDEED